MDEQTHTLLPQNPEDFEENLSRIEMRRSVYEKDNIVNWKFVAISASLIACIAIVAVLSTKATLTCPEPDVGAISDTRRAVSRIGTSTSAHNPWGYPEHYKFFMYDFEDTWEFYPVHKIFNRKYNNGYGTKQPNFEFQGHNINGNWLTDHYSLEMSTRFRMMQSPYRTADPDEALFFYVPFWGSEIYHEKNRTIIYEEIMRKIKTDYPHWNRTNGLDHVVFYGRMGDDGEMHKREDIQNMTYVTVEVHHGKCRSTYAVCATYKPAPIIEKTQYKQHAVPYPAGFHWGNGVTRRFDYGMFNRTWLISMSFGPRYNWRQQLQKQCREYERCKVVGWNGKWSAEAQRIVIGGYMDSVFCVQPPGDSWTRRGIFDSMHNGCIPVIFHEEQSKEQYKWHVPDFDKVAVMYPWDNIINEPYGDLMKFLADIPQEEIEKKQREIAETAHMTQYSLGGNPDGSMDAFDITLHELFLLKEADTKERGDIASDITKNVPETETL